MTNDFMPWPQIPRCTQVSLRPLSHILCLKKRTGFKHHVLLHSMILFFCVCKQAFAQCEAVTSTCSTPSRFAESRNMAKPNLFHCRPDIPQQLCVVYWWAAKTPRSYHWGMAQMGITQFHYDTNTLLGWRPLLLGWKPLLLG